MTRPAFPTVAALCAAALLGTTALPATAANTAAPSAGQPKPRTGAYKVVKRGPRVIRARCLEGGNVAVPTHEKSTAAERDHDIHEACKTVDYTK